MIRAIEIGDHAAPDAGRLLVGLGADVTVVEPPGGVAARRDDPLGFVHRAAGKSSVLVDDAASVAAGCDVILDGTHGGPLAATVPSLVAAAGPDVVHVVLTPYGDEGPAARWASSDLTVAAAGGMLAMIGEPDRPPLRPYGDQADQLAGLNAVIAALLAVRERERTGAGRRIVVSGQAAVASSLEFGGITYIHTGRVFQRTGSTHPLAPHTLFTVADGMLAGGLGGSPRMWDALLAWLKEMGVAGELADERWSDPAYRVAHREEIFARLAEIVGSRKRDDFFHDAQSRRLPWAAVLGPDELADNAQLVHRGFFREVETPKGTATDVGFAVRVEGAAPPARLRVPEPGERLKEVPSVDSAAPAPGRRARSRTATGRGALEGVRVLDLTWVLAGPYATKILADNGAEVVKVESRHRPDPTRFAPDFRLPRDAEPGPDTSAYFNNYNRNKKSITLNLRTAEGRDLALRLARESDVVIENFAAGVLDRLGLGYDRLKEEREDIVVVSMSGMGHTGPWRDYVSYADAISALSGWTALTGELGRPPVGIVYGLADIIAGYHAALATLGALAVRDRTGRGQHVDLAQLECAASHLGDAVLRAGLGGESVGPLGNRHPRMSPHGVFRCLGESSWVAIAARTDEEAERLAAVAGLGDDPWLATLEGRQANEDELESRITAWTRPRTAEGVAETLQREGVPAYPVRDGRSLVEHDAALRAWGFYQPADHPVAGTFLHEGSAVRSDGPPSPAPLLGEHTRETLAGLLGMQDDEIDALHAQGVLQ